MLKKLTMNKSKLWSLLIGHEPISNWLDILKKCKVHSNIINNEEQGGRLSHVMIYLAWPTLKFLAKPHLAEFLADFEVSPPPLYFGPK